VCEMVASHSLEMGHARALLGLTNKRKQAEVGALVAKKGLSVRDTEALVRRMQQPEGGRGGDGASQPSGDPNVQRLEQELAEKLGAKVLIQHTPTGMGKVIVAYNSLDELDGILAHIK
jgi:ParB family chromosome partitioning protein